MGSSNCREDDDGCCSVGDNGCWTIKGDDCCSIWCAGCGSAEDDGQTIEELVGSIDEDDTGVGALGADGGGNNSV